MPIDPLIGGSIIAAAGAGAQAISAGFGNKKRIAAAKEAATVANQRNIENWERANKYNDPSAAMARLKAAGLNPNMVYGTGSATGGTAGAVGGASAPVPNIQDIPINMPDALGILGQYQNIEKAKAQTALTWGQLGVQALTIDSKKLSIEGQKLQNQILEKTGMEIAQAGLKATRAGTAKTEESTKLVVQQRENAEVLLTKLNQDIENARQSNINQKTVNALNQVKLEIEQKYLTRWKETGVDPRSSQFFRLVSEVFTRMISGNTTDGKNPPITQDKLESLFPGQIKDLTKEQKRILDKLINAQY